MITYNGTDLSTYNIEYAKHESMPDRNLSTLDRGDTTGSIIISDRFGQKTILLKGLIIGSSRSDCDTQIESLTSLFSLKEKNLDIVWKSGTRRYIATCKSLSIDREHYHINSAPWSAELIVISGYSEDTATTTPISSQLISPSASTPATVNFTIDGSDNPSPLITLIPPSTINTIYGLAISNSDTGQKLLVDTPTTLASGINVIIDTKNKTAKIGGLDRTVYGQYPQFYTGSNNITIESSNVIMEGWDNTLGATDYYHLYGTYKYAQSFFVDHTLTSFHRLYLYGYRFVLNAGNMLMNIYTDNNGQPSSTSVASYTLSVGSLTTSSDWIRIYSSASNYTLQSGNLYWLTMDANGIGNSGEYIAWLSSTGKYNTYNRGNAMQNDGSGWTNLTNTSLLFRVAGFGALSNTDLNLSVSYNKKYI